MSQNKRKICFVITSRVHYDRSKEILREIKSREDLELQIVVGASAILPSYGDVLSAMKKDGFECNEKIIMTLAGGSSVAMAKTTGIGIVEFATVFDNLEPDVVVVRGDRYEILSAVIAAAYLNIAVAHIEGGDLSGTIDESVRHAITKLSHIHFSTNPEAKERIIKMGENPENVFDFGGPEIEFLTKNSYEVSSNLINFLGVGDVIDIGKPYMIMMQHPVTSELESNRENMTKTLEAVYECGIPTICFWPNIDAGTDEASKSIRVFRENKNPHHMRFIKYLPAEQFLGLLKGASCLVGNSSAGIKECSYFGLPVVDIGTRQSNRMKAENVMWVDHDKEQIKGAILKQLERTRYPSSDIYHKPNTAKNITDILASHSIQTQKKFHNN